MPCWRQDDLPCELCEGKEECESMWKRFLTNAQKTASMTEDSFWKCVEGLKDA